MSNRVSMVIAMLDGPAVKALHGPLDDLPSSRRVILRRPARPRYVSSLGNIGTGNIPHRHGIHTMLIPLKDGEDAAGAGSTADAGLRLRTFRDSGVPFFWDRLASRGVPTAALGFPVARIQGESTLIERPFSAIYGDDGSRSETLLAAFESLAKSDPDLRCVVGWLPNPGNRRSDDTDAEGMDDPESVEPDDPAIAEAGDFVRFISSFRDRFEADHHVWVIMGPRYGHVVVQGPRAKDVHAESMQEIDVAPTVLDLLGEDLTGFIKGASILDADRNESDDGPSTSSWEVEDLPVVPADMDPLVDSVIDGDPNPTRRRVATTHLRSVFWYSLSHNYLKDAAKSADAIVRIVANDVHLFWSALVSSLMRADDRRDEAVRRLRDEFPDSNLTKIVPALPGMNTGMETLTSVLNAVPPKTLVPVAQGLWGRAAIEAGMAESGSEILESLYRSGFALRIDCVALADFYVGRNADGDMKNALQVLATLPNAWVVGDGRVDVAVLQLRAIAYSRIGRTDEAIRILERFLASYPMERKASDLLNQLRSSDPGSAGP